MPAFSGNGILENGDVERGIVDNWKWLAVGTNAEVFAVESPPRSTLAA
jgi:hypothetical protein